MTAPLCRAEISAGLHVAVGKPDRTIGARLYGVHVEHMFSAIQGGLWGERLANRKLVAQKGAGGALPAPWITFGDKDAAVETDAPKQAVAAGDLARSVRLEAPEGRRVGVAQGRLALRPGDAVRLTVWLRGEGGGILSASLGDASDAVTVPLPAPAGQWRKAAVSLRLPKGAREARLTLSLRGPGVAWLYAPSLMTEAAFAAGGFEPAVLARARALAPQYLRYPGGNFAQNYDWRDGVGPRDERPARRSVWGGLPEPNDVGTDEFLALCGRLKAGPILVVNVGGAGMGPQDAADWVAYCNASANSEVGRRRAANGHPAPHGVRVWEVGNEIYGDWVSGHTDAAAYARSFGDYAAAMRMADPKVELIAVGQTPKWNAQVLAGVQNPPDFLSLHLYVSQSTPADVLGEPIAYEAFLREVGQGVRKARPGEEKRAPRLAVNEWNLNMKEANQTWLSALFAASLLNVFQRTPNVAMASVNGLVNGWEGGLIQRDGARFYTTPTHTVLALYRKHTGTQGLPVAVRTGSIPRITSDEVGISYPVVDVVASKDARGKVYLCVVNKSPAETALLSFVLEGVKPRAAADFWTLQAQPSARNDFDAPERIQPGRRRAAVQKGRFVGRFPPFSVTCVAVS